MDANTSKDKQRIRFMRSLLETTSHTVKPPMAVEVSGVRHARRVNRSSLHAFDDNEANIQRLQVVKAAAHDRAIKARLQWIA
jgi:hypothetical protein